MGKLMGQPLTERDALMISPLRLAYIGDAVHDLHVRARLILGGETVRAMHRGAVGFVSAGAQARALSRISEQLTDIEADVVRRGRNAHAHHGVPKHADAKDYALATALEALFGFLYLTGRMERLQALFAQIEREE